MKKKIIKSLKQNNGGFSLVEVMVALLILAVCLVPLTRSFVLAARQNAKARVLLDATTLAENIMEDVKATGVESYGSANGEYVTIDGVDYPVYAAGYASYPYDNRNYQISIRMAPTEDTYDDGSSSGVQLNAQKLDSLVSMGQLTDAFYVQGPDEVSELATQYVLTNQPKRTLPNGTQESIQSAEIEEMVTSEYRFIIDEVNGFIKVNREVSYIYEGDPLSRADALNIFDQVQTGTELRTLYIFVLPSQKNTITIENPKDLPVTVYLVCQDGSSASPEIDLVIDDGEVTSPAATQIRSNWGANQFHSIHRGSMVLASAMAKQYFGFKGINETDGAFVRMYDVTVVVKDEAGNQLTELTGTALK